MPSVPTSVTIQNRDSADTRRGRMMLIMIMSALAMFALVATPVLAAGTDTGSSGNAYQAPKADSADMRKAIAAIKSCLLYTSPSPRDRQKSRMPSSA